MNLSPFKNLPPKFCGVHPARFLLIFLLLWGTVLISSQAVQAATCLTAGCHSEIAQNVTIHPPVEEDCLLCHLQKSEAHPTGGEGDISTIAGGADLCYMCHESLESRKHMHAPVADGDCLVCHQPHGSKGPHLLKTGEVVQDQRPVCLQCHDEEAFDQPYGHGPVELGACTVCHAPHGAENPALLREKAQTLCLGCHADFAKGLANAAYIHSAVTEKDCTACHQPHGSSKPALLKKEMLELCFGCHQGIKDKARRGESRHQPLLEEGYCGNCHLIHYGDQPALLFKEERPLCLGCHAREKTSSLYPLGNEPEALKGKYLHGPLEAGQCTPCHDPHGSEFADLLKGSYPGTFYAPYREGTYDFCFECHVRDLLVTPDTEQTDFRNGTRNLHFVHVAREVKGRTCTACHAVHLSDSPKLINKRGVPFGSWRIPLRFEKTETGGSCAPGCHRKMKYDRRNQVDNSQ